MQKPPSTRAATEAQLRHALPETGRGTWRDPGLPGLELTGRRARASWYFRTTIDGTRVRERLGVWPALGCADAREAARAWAATAASRKAAGVDVLAQRDAKRRKAKARAGMMTLREAITGEDAQGEPLEGSYWHYHLQHLRTGSTRRKDLVRFFASFLDRRPCDINAAMLRRHVETEARRIPAQTGVVLRVARPMWRWMAKQGWCDDALQDMKPPKDGERDRDLTMKEMARIWLASEAERPTAVTGPLVRLLILTAQRRSEVTQMRRGEIDFEERVWTLPPERTKTATPYVVPLTDAALAEIESACAISGATKPEDRVFRTGHARRADPDGAFDGFSRLQARIRKRADLSEPWIFHDFRAAFVGRCAENGIDPGLADRCLNHAATSTSTPILRRYQRSALLEPRREVFNLWADLLAVAVGAAKGKNVVALEDRA